MTIERDKYYIFYCCTYAIACTVIPIVCIFKFGTSVWFALLCNSPIILVVLPGAIASGRKFVFDKDGITVSFWLYKKTYTWTQLRTKRIEKHDLPSMLAKGSPPYLNEAIFSPYNVRKPRFIRASTYSFFHPFTCIFVNFSTEDNTYTTGRYYEISEGVFREKMNDWGIVLEELK